MVDLRAAGDSGHSVSQQRLFGVRRVSSKHSTQRAPTTLITTSCMMDVQFRIRIRQGYTLLSAEEEDQISGRYQGSALPCCRRIHALAQRGRAETRRVAQWSLRTGVDLGGEYSTKVPQQVRIWRDADTRSGTVTCGYGRWWTGCLLFASRGSGVRVPLAPLVRSEIRTAGPKVQQQSTAAGPHGNAARAFELGFALAGGWGLRHTDPRPWVGTRAFEQEERHRRVLRRLPGGQRQRGESAVSRPVLAGHAEGQRMASYFRHPR